MSSFRPKMGCLVVLCLLALFGLAWARLRPVRHSRFYFRRNDFTNFRPKPEFANADGGWNLTVVHRRGTWQETPGPRLRAFISAISSKLLSTCTTVRLGRER